MQHVTCNIIAGRSPLAANTPAANSQPLTATEADQLAEYLGDLPLALHLAGGYLGLWHSEGMPLTVADYLAELESTAVLDHESLQKLEVGALPTQHVQSLYATFLPSYRKLAEGELAQRLLYHAACFEPGTPFPTWMLASGHGGEPEQPRLFVASGGGLRGGAAVF